MMRRHISIHVRGFTVGRLGPLGLVGDRWVLGDPKREGGECLVLTSDGMEHHRNAAAEPEAVIPWPRFMQLHLRATGRGWTASRPMGVFGAGHGTVVGPDGCAVTALLRHPYEDWSARYSHHEHRYTAADVFWLEHLFRHTVEAKSAHRLGDPEWLGTAVARLAELSPSWSLTANRRAADVIADLHRVSA
ncbi:hypothetical protein ABZ957_09225 [Streptomyces sp. NPDC046316]|uniref:hypothetical protein n=1 Tax=unclassified Streptomyces TaxID=2593676 RepID=UPI0033C4BCB1